MADTYLSWWTSIEVDLRKSLVINAMRDHSAMHSLIRNAFDAGLSSATQQSPCTAPEVDVRYEFERWMSQRGESAVYIGDGLYSNGAVSDQAEAFAAGVELSRAALASRPAEVGDRLQAVDAAGALLADAQQRRAERCERLGIAEVDDIAEKAAAYDHVNGLAIKAGFPSAVSAVVHAGRQAHLESIDHQLTQGAAESNNLPCLLCKINHGRGCWAHKAPSHTDKEKA